MNWQTILVASIISVIVIAIIGKGLLNKKQGKGSCSCGCSGCAMKDKCHPQNNIK